MPYVYTAARILLIGMVAAVSVSILAPKPGPQWHITDIAGHLPDLDFTLIDDHDRTVTADIFKGKIILLYFGFTGCSSQCPLAMDRLAKLLVRLGPDASGMRVLFVTVDPLHDRPSDLRRFLSAFDKEHMIGLTGTPEELSLLFRRYRTAWLPNNSGGIIHGGTVYVFDQQGGARFLLTPQDNEQDAVTDLRRLAKR